MNQDFETKLIDNYQPPITDIDNNFLSPIQPHTHRPYPKTKVILSYIFLGGMLGGLLLWIGVGLFLDDIYRDAEIFILAIIGGGIIGFLPALITALCVVKLKIYLKDILDYIKVFAIGSLVSASLTSLAFFILSMFEPTQNAWLIIMGYGLTLGAVGGLSGLIIAHFVLPKPSQSKGFDAP